ncbi:Uncharacterised protein [Flavonifractor plautii]|uniref:Uncharacterized protein n=1 Tax=Flavonifractor plautii TaxID=292800 RepID=A0A174U3Y4_FLAPL|nr:Uncharacterised protein [Flavonifractor plautii]
MSCTASSNSAAFTPAAWRVEGMFSFSMYRRAVRMRLRALWRTLLLSSSSRREIRAYRLAVEVSCSAQPALKLIT